MKLRAVPRRDRYKGVAEFPVVLSLIVAMVVGVFKKDRNLGSVAWTTYPV
jgi:hypothetical protein